MIIPHGPGNPKQVNIHLSHILTFFLFWTAVTGWGSYLSAQHIDYWRTKLTNQVLKLKVNYLVGQLDQSSEFLDEVKQLEAQLRDMLGYTSEAALIQDAAPPKIEPATGGPTRSDQKDITGILRGKERDITWNRLMEMTGFLKNEARTRISTYEDLSNYVELRRRMYRATPRGWPAPGHVTSHYGKRLDPFSSTEEFHRGVDIAVPTGTKIKATADGRVRISGWHSGYGYLVVLEHDFGYTTRYAHNSKLLVKNGEDVQRGDVIALSGATGRASGPHCHYEVWRYNTQQNPYAYIREMFPKMKGQAIAPAKKTTLPANAT